MNINKQYLDEIREKINEFVTFDYQENLLDTLSVFVYPNSKLEDRKDKVYYNFEKPLITTLIHETNGIQQEDHEEIFEHVGDLKRLIYYLNGIEQLPVDLQNYVDNKVGDLATCMNSDDASLCSVIGSELDKLANKELNKQNNNSLSR